MHYYAIMMLAHRTAWKYKHSGDPAHSDTYTFNDTCMVDFVRKVQAQAIEACARVCDAKADACNSDSLTQSILRSQAEAIRSMLPNQTSETSERQPMTQAALMELYERLGGKPTRPTVNETKVHK